VRNFQLTPVSHLNKEGLNYGSETNQNFRSPSIPFENQFWAETLVGSIVAPLSNQTKWFWFSRYWAPKEVDTGDCDINLIPDEFGIDQNGTIVGATGVFRSLRFRYEFSDEQINGFETTLRELIETHHCVISDFRAYMYLDDLGGDRFIGGERTQQRRLERAELMTKYLCDTCQLFIHCLQGPDQDGRFQLEMSDSNQNPHGSIFESVHHLLCNITNVPLRILISQNGIGTDWNRPVITDGANVTAVPIRF
jgi:hypothetical protein